MTCCGCSSSVSWRHGDSMVVGCPILVGHAAAACATGGTRRPLKHAFRCLLCWAACRRSSLRRMTGAAAASKRILMRGSRSRCEWRLQGQLATPATVRTL